MNPQRFNVSIVFADTDNPTKRMSVTLTEVERARLENMRLHLGRLLDAFEEATAVSAT